MNILTLFKYFIFSLFLSTIVACGGGNEEPEDTAPPVITLNGDSIIILTQGDTYTELGAIAVDDIDGDVSVTISSDVDTDSIGTDTITYGAEDSAGNTSTATRTVEIIAPVDTRPPTISLNGDAIINLMQGDVYTELGATAVDEVDGDIEISVSGEVNTSVIGTYIITYTANDSSANTSTATRTVYVNAPADITPPVISLIGDAFVILLQGEQYIEKSATAIDETDGTVAVTISGEVVSNTIGEYIITYSATDSSGNSSSIIRTVNVITPRPFVTIWKTDNNGSSADNQITLTRNITLDYNYTVDWGDGQIDSNITTDITHTYATPGTYTVKISGDFPSFRVGFERDKLLSVEQWGDINWKSMSYSFFEAPKMVLNATDSPKLSLVTDMKYMFSGAKQFNSNINNWDVSSVKDMVSMFSNAILFDQPLDNWNVSSVTDMRSMFVNAASFNQAIADWDVSSVTNMATMFVSASTFNQDISNWNVSSVTDMNSMFSGATAFNQPLDSWDISSVTDIRSMFREATAFNQSLNTWNVSGVTNMNSVFEGASSFNQAIGDWDLSSVLYMANMFKDAITFNQPIGNWNVSKVLRTTEMFHNATSFNQDINNWDLSSVTDMSSMFYNAQNFNQPIGNWNVSSVTNMDSMFREAQVFNQDISSWNVSNVTNMAYMFLLASNFNQPIGSWDVSSVTRMVSMFHDASSFNQPLNSWVISSVSDMSSMFTRATRFDQPLNNWDVSSVQLMFSMFRFASSYNRDLSNWNVSSVLNMVQMLEETAFSTENYDAVLNSWSMLTLKNNVYFSVGTTKYSPSSQPARDVLIDTFNWNITDGGLL